MNNRSTYKIVFRCDANTQIGMGHVMRCLALAQKWRDLGGEAVFVFSSESAILQKLFEGESIAVMNLQVHSGSLEDAEQTLEIATRVGASWIIVDGYQFSQSYLVQITHRGPRVMLIHDFALDEKVSVDAILNQNLHARANLYPGAEENIDFLLGSRFVLLRREFLSSFAAHPQKKIPKNVLISLGGSDLGNISLKTLDALNQLAEFSLMITIVVGALNPHLPSLLAAEKESPHKVLILQQSTNMAHLMQETDIAIAAGGTTSYELLHLGVPALLYILAKNQEPTVKELQAKGACVSLGWGKETPLEIISANVKILLSSMELREKLSLSGKSLVDGRGSDRVCQYLQQPKTHIRLVEESDCRQIWEWNNAPEVREVSFSAKNISWEEHKSWFDHAMRDPNHVMLMGVDERGEGVGQVRFKIEGEVATLSIVVAPHYQGQGLGRVLLQKSTRMLSKMKPIVARVLGHVRKDNKRSSQTFVAEGFTSVSGESKEPDYDTYELILPRSLPSA